MDCMSKLDLAVALEGSKTALKASETIPHHYTKCIEALKHKKESVLTSIHTPQDEEERPVRFKHRRSGSFQQHHGYKTKPQDFRLHKTVKPATFNCAGSDFSHLNTRHKQSRHVDLNISYICSHTTLMLIPINS